jgi:hypothetical protein
MVLARPPQPEQDSAIMEILSTFPGFFSDIDCAYSQLPVAVP